jgi:RNA polymerase sigma-70 factor (ECF subfamily)
MATIFESRIQAQRPCPRAPLQGASDAVLLDRFIDGRDESAFAELVHRHSAMVLGVCRRVLNNAHDAEDCFQAAFMVLVRKADTIEPRAMVGNWLYGVAYRTALEARKLAARRRDMERKKPAPAPADNTSEIWADLKPVLDQELTKLPDKYRAVVVACDLQGMTRQEAAEALGLPEGTVASRLARARALLARRLSRYSLNVTTIGIAVLLTEHAAAIVPSGLIAATIGAGARIAAGKGANGLLSPRASTLTDLVVGSMKPGNLKIAAVIAVILAVLTLGVSAFLPSAQAERKPEANKPELRKVDDPKIEKPEVVANCVVQNVDLVKQTIHTLRSTMTGDEESICDVRVTPQTAIVIDGRDGKLADLQTGDTVNIAIERQPDGIHQAIRIEKTGAERSGVVHALTADTITLRGDDRTHGKVAEETTYEIDDGVWVYVNGKKAKFGDLKSRMKVTVKLSTGKPRVVGVSAAGPKLIGAVERVDADRHVLTLNGSPRPVAPDAAIRINDAPGRLSDIEAGMNVAVRLSADADCIVGIFATPLRR